MKIYKANIEVRFGEPCALETNLYVCKNIQEARRRANKYVKECNAASNFVEYAVENVEELREVDNYKVTYTLRKEG